MRTQQKENVEEEGRYLKSVDEINSSRKDRRLILHLYSNQRTAINISGKMQEARIMKGVRQGCLHTCLVCLSYSNHQGQNKRNKSDW